jgi:hypothetical protein
VLNRMPAPIATSSFCYAGSLCRFESQDARFVVGDDVFDRVRLEPMLDLVHPDGGP